MKLHVLAISLALVSACGKSDKQGEGASRKPDKPATGDVASLFGGASVTLPAEVAKVAFGDKKDAVLAAVGATSGYLPSKTHADVSYDLDFSKADNLERISVATRGTQLEPILTKRWGPAITTAKGELFWFDAAAGLRAWLPKSGKGERVTFSPYESIPKLLGSAGFDLAFAKDKPLFGATMAELKAAWGPRLCDFDREAAKLEEAYAKNVADGLYRIQDVRPELKLCPTWPRGVEQYSPSHDSLRLGLDQKAYALHMSFPTGGSPELVAQTLAELDAKYGKPTELTDDGAVERFYFDPATKQRAVVRVDKDHNYVGLTVGPYLPVAELIGGESPAGLAIETPSMVGGTFDQIAKEHPDHARRHAPFLSLVFPPTEWSMWQTEVDLDIYAKQTKTYGYHVVVHHSHNEAGGDAVFELLKTKYGAPRSEKKDDKGTTYAFANGGRKLSAWRVNDQWQLRFTK